jgi:HSP20 family protein
MSPLIDVSETDKGVEVTVELPGVDEKDIDVSLANDVLTIKGEKKSETEKTAKDYHLIERAYGAFERSTRLPCEVDASKVKAEFKNGVLKVKLPKTPEAKAKSHKISVTAS